jgi:hypothetical protein
MKEASAAATEPARGAGRSFQEVMKTWFITGARIP